MIQVVEQSPASDTLVDRLIRGGEILFEMEARGERSPEYERWLARWLEMLDRYEGGQAA